MAAGPSAAVMAFIEEHSDAELMDSGKVLCTVTRHELVPNIDLLEHHWNGKKYATRKSQSQYDFTAHEPWIVPHSKDHRLLYCTLTKQPLSRQPKTVMGHVNGKRFQRLLAEAKKGGVRIEVSNKKRTKAEEEEEGEDIYDDDEEDGEPIEDDHEGDQDVEDAGDEGEESDAVEFLREGAFWQDGEEDSVSSSGDGDDGALRASTAKTSDPGHSSRQRSVADYVDDDDDAFWVRGAQELSRSHAKEPLGEKKKKKKKKTATARLGVDSEHVPDVSSVKRAQKAALGLGRMKRTSGLSEHASGKMDLKRRKKLQSS